jgi:hypothetical protein
MTSVPCPETPAANPCSQATNLKEQLAIAKREFAQATKEYEAVKAKLMAVIRGESSLPENMLSEMADEAGRKIMFASEKVSGSIPLISTKTTSHKATRLVVWPDPIDNSYVINFHLIAFHAHAPAADGPLSWTPRNR